MADGGSVALSGTTKIDTINMNLLLKYNCGDRHSCITYTKVVERISDKLFLREICCMPF